jgi:GNAT superfamily N-acetyltransferase
MSPLSNFVARAPSECDVEALDLRRRADRERFLAVAPALHPGDPMFVPPLRVELRRLLDARRNPFFRHAEMECFLARKGRDVVGRIAAIHDRLHDERRGEAVGFFGFFETIDDDAVAGSLLAAAEQWVSARGAKRIRGPLSPSMHDECGSLVEGFDSPPVVMMPYNPPHHAKHFELHGYRKDRDLLAYELLSRHPIRPAIVRIAQEVESSGEFRVRDLDVKRFDREVDLVRRVYNSAWEDNWGFVPLDEDEFRWRAASLKSIIDPRFALIIEAKSGDDWIPAAFGLAIPDVNEILVHLSGRLTPVAIVRLLYGLRRVTTMRVIMLGVVREFRRRGLEAVLLKELHGRAARFGIARGELSWVLENNDLTNRMIVKAGGRVYKVYRIYGKSLD